MGILSGHSDLTKPETSPPTAERIKTNHHRTTDLQILRDAFEVIDDLGDWEMRDIPHLHETFLAAYGLVELKLSQHAVELERLLELEAEEKKGG